MSALRGSSSSRAANATPAGSEAIGQPQLRKIPRYDTSLSHQRNGLQILELLRGQLAAAGRPDELEPGPVLQAVAGAIETFAAAARILEAAHASPASAPLGYAKTALYDLVDDLSRRRLADERVIDRAEAVNTWLDVVGASIAELLDRERHASAAADEVPQQVARELENSTAAAAQMVGAIGAAAAAAFTADLLTELTRRGYLVSWRVEPTGDAVKEGVLVFSKPERDELARRREGMRRDLEDMETTTRELADLRLASDEPPELQDPDRSPAGDHDDATGRR